MGRKTFADTIDNVGSFTIQKVSCWADQVITSWLQNMESPRMTIIVFFHFFLSSSTKRKIKPATLVRLFTRPGLRMGRMSLPLSGKHVVLQVVEENEPVAFRCATQVLTKRIYHRGHFPCHTWRQAINRLN